VNVAINLASRVLVSAYTIRKPWHLFLGVYHG
jgi:hypothetical protein